MFQPWLCCPICKIVGPRRDRLCPRCTTQLHPLRSVVIRPMEGYTIKSLFAWTQTCDKPLAALVYGLKGVEEIEGWRRLSIWLLQAFGETLPPRSVFVPVAGRRPNHSLGFARALAAITARPCLDLLATTTEDSQKTLDREGRRKVGFTLRGRDLVPLDHAIVLVDDVVTTGSTVAAAFRALGAPQNSQAWCLIDRRPCDA